MNINIRAVNMELTPAIKQYVEEKFTSLDKFTGDIMQIDVDLGKESNHHNKGKIMNCAAVLELKGDVIKVERAAEDLYKAIDKVRDHLRETLAQMKEKKIKDRQS
ncbi:MAG: ribosome-associated translation inhibitor RaiA [Patescibacteria group bacterium]